MGDRRLTEASLRWLRGSVGEDGLVKVRIGGGSRPVIDRFVMILLAAGLLQPVALAYRGSQPDQIAYAVVDGEEGATGSSEADAAPGSPQSR
jgi:hypothetical protein